MINFASTTATINSADITGLAEHGLIGVFIAILIFCAILVLATMWVRRYEVARDQERLERNDARVVEQQKALHEENATLRREETVAKKALAEALLNVTKIAEVNGVKIDSLADRVTGLSDRVGDCEEKLGIIKEDK